MGRPSREEIVAQLRTNTSEYEERAKNEQQKEEDQHLFARSILEMARLDTEELVSINVADISVERGGERKKAQGHNSTPNKSRVTTDNNSIASNSYVSSDSSNAVFTKIQDLKKSMRKADDKLQVALEIARLYVTINLQKLSIPFFQMAVKMVPFKPPTVHPQDEEIEKRKLERMASVQKERYLQEKEDELMALKEEHKEKQRVRVMSSHYEIFCAHLHIKNPEQATEHMKAWLSMTRSKEERLESLLVLDEKLSGYHYLEDLGIGEWKDENFSYANVHLDKSLGSLRDLHIEVLDELLFGVDGKEYLGDSGKYKKLAQLYGLRREFGKSQELWEHLVQLRDGGKLSKFKEYKHPHFYSDKLVRSPRFQSGFGARGEECTKSVGVLGAGGVRVGGWSVNAIEDRLKDAKRRDFVEFRMGNNGMDAESGKNEHTFKSTLANQEVSGGAHIGATTIVYVNPPGGWSDDDRPMRTAKGGYVDAVGTGKERVEKEIRADGQKFLHGYKVGIAGARSETTGDNENGDDCESVEVVLERAKLGRKGKSTLIEESLGNEGQLRLPLSHAVSSGEHQVEEAAWKKGGMLPPRLYIEHDFRQHMEECGLVHPEVRAIRGKTQSVFNKDNQQFNIPPLIRYKKNGSQVTAYERGRIRNIKAIPGRFGKTIEVDPNERKGGEDPRLILKKKHAAKAKLKKDREGRVLDINEGKRLNIEKKAKMKSRRMTTLVDGSLMPSKGM